MTSPPLHRKIFIFVKDLVWKVVPQKIGLRMRHLYFQRSKFNKQDWIILHVSVSGKCNLNCVSCNAFSPIADDYLLDINSFESDCMRLSELGAEKILGLNFVGGEPLLHPRINEILSIARSNFPYAKINIVTNGILLQKKEDDFWECCKQNSIGLIVSHYPIKINIKKIKKIAKSNNVELRYFRGVLPWYKMAFDVNGSGDAHENYKNCHSALSCIEMRDGTIAPCQVIQKVQYFNKYFNENLELKDNDRIDIYKAGSIDEILEFVANPVPFCRYCKVEWIPVEWSLSKKKLSEWT